MVIRFLSSIFTFVNKFVNEPKPASMKHLWKYIAGALAFALPVASCSDEVKAIYHKLKDRVDECPDFRPDMPGAPRRGDYGTFYDFAEPNNPF
mgnify:CR=1 FL=1